MTKTLIIAAFILSSVFVLTSCGKKGDLQRPIGIAPDVYVTTSATLIKN